MTKDTDSDSAASLGSVANERERLRLIAMADERNEFMALEDGTLYWWPDPGAVASYQLRWIADELDRRNATMQSFPPAGKE